MQTINQHTFTTIWAIFCQIWQGLSTGSAKHAWMFWIERTNVVIKVYFHRRNFIAAWFAAEFAMEFVVGFAVEFAVAFYLYAFSFYLNEFFFNSTQICYFVPFKSVSAVWSSLNYEMRVWSSRHRIRLLKSFCIIFKLSLGFVNPQLQKLVRS